MYLYYPCIQSHVTTNLHNEYYLKLFVHYRRWIMVSGRKTFDLKKRDMEVLGIVPARAGSKRIPGKNILPLVAKPLIAWTIEAALATSTISRLIVSTDGDEIAEVATAYGAEVPFMRPD